MKVIKVTYMRRMIMILGLAAIAFLNFVGALPRMYIGVGHQVGSDIVKVVRADDSDGNVLRSGQRVDLSMPVFESGSSTPTGQRVIVYLHNSYKDEKIEWYPRMTLCILGGTVLLNLIFWLTERKNPEPSRESPVA